MDKGKVISSNNIQYRYFVKDREIKNPLGVVVAVLKEYAVFPCGDDIIEDLLCSICKTKDGSWYDMEGTELPAVRPLLPQLKSAIDKAEVKDQISMATA